MKNLFRYADHPKKPCDYLRKQLLVLFPLYFCFQFAQTNDMLSQQIRFDLKKFLGMVGVNLTPPPIWLSQKYIF